MGLSSGLHDVSGAAPLPLLLLASLASALASLFSASPGAGANANTSSSAAASVRFSGFATLVALADYLVTSYVSTADGTAVAGDCTVCLSAIAQGDRVRTLVCRHAFHAACLDGWFDQSSFTCPICRTGPPAREDDVDRRADEDAVMWFSSF